MTPAKALDEGEQPEQNLQSARTGVPVSMPSDTNPGAALFFDTFLFLLLLPLLPIWIGLRHAGILPWTLQARCRPWGRHGTPVVLRWRVKGDAESHRAFQDIVSALERGDEAPVIAGAQRVR
jgi:hypothetical protein